MPKPLHVKSSNSLNLSKFLYSGLIVFKLIICFVYFGNDVSSAGTHSFVEIYNPENEIVALTGKYSLHYKSGSSEWLKLDLEGQIPAKRSFLVNLGTAASPVSFNQTEYKVGRLDLAGKKFDQDFAAAYGKATLNGAVAVKANDKTLDLVGIAAGTNCEGACLANPASATGYVRKKTAGGYTDSDNNSEDFIAVNFSTLDLAKSICLPRNSNDGLRTGTLSSCPAFAESYETIGLQPGSDATGVNFNWYSSNATGNKASFVRILSSAGAKNTKGSYGPAPSTTSGKYYHRVNATGLQQGTEYKYQLSNDSANWGPVYSYKTAPKGSFAFMAVSDAQLNSVAANANNWKTVVAKSKNKGVNFIVHAGDQVDATSTLNTEYKEFFAPNELRNIPFAPVMGNHDSHCEFLYRYNLPNEQNRPKSCAGIDNAGNYYYLYNNVLFIGLNTAYYPSSKPNAQPFIDNYDRVIKTAKAANSGKYDFIVVNHHKSTQSIASHAADTDIQYYVEAGFERIMTENGVSLVLAGHDHINARSKFLMWNETEKKSVPNENTGTIYLTLSTASGIKYYAPFTSVIVNNSAFPYLADGRTGKNYLSASNPLLGMETYKYTSQPEYTIVDVSDSVMTLTTYRNDAGNPIDEFRITTENIPRK